MGGGGGGGRDGRRGEEDGARLTRSLVAWEAEKRLLAIHACAATNESD